VTIVQYPTPKPRHRATPAIAVYAHAALLALLAWGAFAFGAVYPWAYWPLAAASVAIGVVGLTVHRRVSPKPLGLSALAAAFGLFLAAGLVQLAPLSLTQLASVSPESTRVIMQLNLAMAAGTVHRHPLSISPDLTRVGMALFASTALLVVGGACLLSLRGARRVAEALPVIGAVMALVAIVQKPFANGNVYGLWTPLDGGNPYGPFVNRNHFAGWMLMALPVTLGLVCAGLARAMQGVRPNWRDRLMWFSSPDASRIVLTAAAALLMALSLVITMSRSGITAFAVAVAMSAVFVVRRRWGRGRTAIAIAYLMLLPAVAFGWAGADLIASRFSTADWSELNARRGAWADAVAVSSKFPLTGTGLNTYGVATILYQRHDLEHHYDQAHNDYLQLAAEGGVLLVTPAALCLGIFAVAVRRRFHHETSATAYWLRVGAVTGLTAIALQETVDFSLQMPGNAALFAVLCAIALHKAPEKRSTP
jgi:O-antigen ligase